MPRRVATPINVPSNIPKRARVSSNIAGSSSTVVLSSSSLFPAPVSAPAPVPFYVPVAAPAATFGSHTGAEAIGAASSFTPEMMAAQMQFFAQTWQQQQQQQQQHPVQQPQQGQQYVSVAEINKIKKQCSVSLKLKYQLANSI
jgi:hypothetical protein